LSEAGAGAQEQAGTKDEVSAPRNETDERANALHAESMRCMVFT
jgi:hypothetical protein